MVVATWGIVASLHSAMYLVNMRVYGYSYFLHIILKTIFCAVASGNFLHCVIQKPSSFDLCSLCGDIVCYDSP